MYNPAVVAGLNAGTPVLNARSLIRAFATAALRCGLFAAVLAGQACTSSTQLAPVYSDMQRDRESGVTYTARPGEVLLTETAPREFAGAQLSEAFVAPDDESGLTTDLAAGTQLLRRQFVGTDKITYCTGDLFVTDFGRKRGALCFRDSDDDRRFDRLEMLQMAPTAANTGPLQRIEPVAYQPTRMTARGPNYASVVTFDGEANGRLIVRLELKDLDNNCTHRRETIALAMPTAEPTGLYLKPWVAIQPVPGNPQGAVSFGDMRKMGSEPEELAHYLSLRAWQNGTLVYELDLKPTLWTYRKPEGFSACP